MDTDALVTRIKSEFNESPGMCLTLRQGARLWGIAPEECAKWSIAGGGGVPALDQEWRTGPLRIGRSRHAAHRPEFGV